MYFKNRNKLKIPLPPLHLEEEGQIKIIKDQIAKAKFGNFNNKNGPKPNKIYFFSNT